MMGTALALPEQAEALTSLGCAPSPPNAPISALTQRILELLRIEGGGLVVDLCWRDRLSSVAILDDARWRSEIVLVRPFAERLARLIATSGVRTVQMDALAFGRFPMRYEKVLLRGGFSRFRESFRAQLTPLFERLEPGGRFLVVDSAPSPDAPLFAEGLRRWEREHCPAEAVARAIEQAGFATRIDVLSCVRPVLTAECGSQPAVTFTSRFELVLGTKPDALADQRTPSLPVSASIRA